MHAGVVWPHPGEWGLALHTDSIQKMSIIIIVKKLQAVMIKYGMISGRLASHDHDLVINSISDN